VASAGVAETVNASPGASWALLTELGRRKRSAAVAAIRQPLGPGRPISCGLLRDGTALALADGQFSIAGGRSAKTRGVDWRGRLLASLAGPVGAASALGSTEDGVAAGKFSVVPTSVTMLASAGLHASASQNLLVPREDGVQARLAATE
jgi:hypothetical protein